MATFDGIGSLAEAVQRAISPSPAVPLENLDRLFRALFFASLRTEEQKRIRFAIAYVDPKNPDPNPPRLAMPHDRALVRFQSPMRATPSSLAKLAQAVNPDEALMAVYSDDQGNPFVWALVDQMIHLTRFEQHGRGSQRSIGAFTATVIAPGVVRADHLRGPIGLLNREVFTGGFSNVFFEGPVSRILAGYAHAAAADVAGRFEGEVWARLDREWSDLAAREVIAGDWVGTFVQLISLVQDGGHGGAVLLVPGPVTEDLHLSYRLPYRRLGDAFVERWDAQIRDRLRLPPTRGMRSPEIEGALREDEIEGAVRFLAGLTRVDGALVMDGRLSVSGFGAEIMTTVEPEHVQRARTSSPSRVDLAEVELDRFGTRHRSMFRYCAAHPGSLGFVVSADGDLRVVTEVDGDVIFWENVATRTSEMSRTSDGP